MCAVALKFLPVIIVDCSRATGVLGFTGFRRGAAATKDRSAAQYLRRALTVHTRPGVSVNVK